jgi:hypothetical protein
VNSDLRIFQRKMCDDRVHQFVNREWINDACKEHQYTNVQTETNLKFWIDEINFSTVRHSNPLNK